MANFFEKLFRIRVVGRTSSSNKTNLSDKENQLVTKFDELDGNALFDTTELNDFVTIASDRESQYKAYDEMTNDPIITAALEMYTDDATQPNEDGKIVWVEAEDPDTKAYVEKKLDELNIDGSAWSQVFALCKYGDVYLETFKEENKKGPRKDTDLRLRKDVQTVTLIKDLAGKKLQPYVRFVPNPSVLFDIMEKGKTVGFVKAPESQATTGQALQYAYQYNNFDNNNEIEIYPNDKYVHILIKEDSNRYPETLKISYEDTEIKKDIITKDGWEVEPGKDAVIDVLYDVNRGRSILHSVYRIYKQVKLMEDTILLNRVTRSSIIRLLQIEVGDMPRSQQRELLKRIKNNIEQKNFMDKTDANSYKSMASPGPVDNVLYIPTKNGVGAISASNLGGDVDIKSIVDLDYFREKLCGALKIPRTFLYGTAAENGLGGGASLAKSSARYARTVKRIQSAYIEGITNLINLFALQDGLADKHIGKFTIKMTSPTSEEDVERVESFDRKVDSISNFMNLLDDENSTPQARFEIIVNFITNYLNKSDISEILNKYKDEIGMTEESEESEGDIDIDIGGSRGPRPSLDIDVEEPIEEPSEETEIPTETIETDNEGFEEFQDVEIPEI